MAIHIIEWKYLFFFETISLKKYLNVFNILPMSPVGKGGWGGGTAKQLIYQMIKSATKLLVGGFYIIYEYVYKWVRDRITSFTNEYGAFNKM